MRKEYVRLINDFREPDDNEFFFYPRKVDLE